MKYSLLLFSIVCLIHVSCSDTDHQQRDHKYNDWYYGENLSRVAFPVGGIGSGMFCIEGTGAVSHMSVRNRPEVFNEPCMFAAISLKDIENGTKVLEGTVPDRKKFGMPGTGNGATGTTYGLPRFQNARFLARFPFAKIILHDDDIPLNVELMAWSPFIPTDPDNSSLPAGALEYTFTNNSKRTLHAVFSYSSRNFMSQTKGRNSIKPVDEGFVLSEDGIEDRSETKGEFAIFTDDPSVVVDHCWFRGGWWDPLTMAWKIIQETSVRSTLPADRDAPGATLFVPFDLEPSKTKTIRLMMSWYVPETRLRYGTDTQESGKVLQQLTQKQNESMYYKPWYAGRFSSIAEVINYWKNNYDDLKIKSELFRDAFYSTTIPPEIIEAVAANLTILKSPTVLRQTDGKLWCWEGCSDNAGCCAGSCTHVWNYAQAIPHLFPALERTLRETEFFKSQDISGHQTFRSALPVRPVAHTFYAAADGQLGGIMKVYRDWRIYGNDEWLKMMFPKVKQSIDYCIITWDPRHTGTLEEPHHNTYDIEFWGPDGMCTSFYLGALRAFCQMGKFLGEDVSKYEELYLKGRKAMEDVLFDGEYFIQKIMWEGLNAPNPVEASKGAWNTDYSEEAKELLQREGPKYQYGKGCLSDGILGTWIAEVCGLHNIIDSAKIRSHLNSIFKYNFRQNLSDHVNPQRPSFALGNEGGLLLCSWPKGGDLSLPFVYSNEVWTGIEYQVASHLMMMDEKEKGLKIVRACRDRYDGRVRNPFNEYECGHWYARAMSSYGLLQGMTGLRFDAVTGTLYLKAGDGDFTVFISTETGFGKAGIKKGKPFCEAVYGTIDVKKFMLL
ncbi:MAG: GH116 family glycosyl hydrolase [Bacteroidales bacterium]